MPIAHLYAAVHRFGSTNTDRRINIIPVITTVTQIVNFWPILTLKITLNEQRNSLVEPLLDLLIRSLTVHYPHFTNYAITRETSG